MRFGLRWPTISRCARNRINVDQSKAQEVTASLKPNPTFSTLVDTIPIFSPQTIRFNTQIYSEGLSYTVEKGGKREKRVVVAKDNTEVAAQTVTDNERTLRFQVAQAFINVLLAKSVLVLAKDDLANFSQEVELNHARLVAGDLGGGRLSQAVDTETPIRAGRFRGSVGTSAGARDSAAATRLSICDRRFRREGDSRSHEGRGHAG